MKVIFFSGPSGMAKTIIIKKLQALSYVLDLSIERTVLTTARQMRAGEKQGDPWYFATLERMKENHRKNPQHYLLREIRPAEYQALDAEREIKSKANSDILWCELNSSWLQPVQEWMHKQMAAVELIKLFIAPLSSTLLEKRAAAEQCSWQQVLKNEMLKRLYARRQAGLDNMSDEKILQRAEHAVVEYRDIDRFDGVLINSQGEESPQWGNKNEFPCAEAAMVFNQIIGILKA